MSTMHPLNSSTNASPAQTTRPAGQATEGNYREIRASVKRFRAGLTEIDPVPYVIICMHLGPSVEVTCIRGGRMRQGREVAGELDIIPARTPSAWEAKDSGTSLVMRVGEELLREVAAELDMDPNGIEIADRFQLRDPILEHIAWAFKADIEAGSASGRFFRESLSAAFAARLLQRHNRRSLPMRDAHGGMSAWKLKQVVTYIEDNLESDLSLQEIAKVAGISVSHLKTLFRQSTGVPVHQYVLRRRVERAKLLLKDHSLSIAHVAFAAGFAHQSHLARHMKRLLGVTPAAARKELVGSG